MKKIVVLLISITASVSSLAQELGTIDSTYLEGIKKELKTVFPKNRTINLVFHGHSVPSGYWSDSKVHILESYPHLLMKKLTEIYPYAVINVIKTSIGGEWAEKGQKRFIADVLPHKPDVLFIDYALNDMGIGLERSKIAWSKMIEEALAKDIKVVLITPSPDQRQDITDPQSKLALHAKQIRTLAAEYKIGLADPFAEFQKIAREKGVVKEVMSHVNHPNQKGHNIIAEEIFRLFHSR